MDRESEIVELFCRILANVRRQFRKCHILIENTKCFKDVSCTVSHAEKNLTLQGESQKCVEVSFSLDSELPEVTEDGRYSVGVSVAVYKLQDKWLCQADVGWSVLELGWDGFRDFSSEYETLQELIDELPMFTSQALDEYVKMINLGNEPV